MFWFSAGIVLKVFYTLQLSFSYLYFLMFCLHFHMGYIGNNQLALLVRLNIILIVCGVLEIQFSRISIYLDPFDENIGQNISLFLNSSGGLGL